MDKEIEEELNWFAEDPADIVRATSPVVTLPKSRVSSPRAKTVMRDSNSAKVKFRVVDNEGVEGAESKKLKQEESKPNRVEEESLNTMSVDLTSRPAKSASEKLAVLEERDRLMRITFALEQEKSTVTPVAKGVCPDMCPEKERILRDVRGIVSSHEAFPDSNAMDHNRAVKEYARSSADQEQPLPHELRPIPVLRMTMDYLITEIMCKIDVNEHENKGNWYDFCWGRLRAIRKDIIQQQLCDLNTVTIVEECARFHICCFDRLWGSPNSVFDDKINSETLMNCLTSLMYMYDDLRAQGKSCPNEAEFRAYLILLKLHSGFVLSEFQQFPQELRKSQRVKEVVEIHTAYSNNMYSTYFMLLKKTTYLNGCLMQRFFGHLRTRAVEVIVKSHCPPNNKSIKISVAYLAQTLKFDNFEDCINFCVDFGFSLNSDGVHLNVSRNDFEFPETMFVESTTSSLVSNKRVSVAESVLGHSNLPSKMNHVIHSSFTDSGFLTSGALDASDQEEKLLRDNVKRSILARDVDENEIENVPKHPSVEVPDQEPEIIKSDDVDMSPAMPYIDDEDGEIEEEEEEEREVEVIQEDDRQSGSSQHSTIHSTASDDSESDSFSTTTDSVSTAASPEKTLPPCFTFIPKITVESPKIMEPQPPIFIAHKTEDAKRFRKMSEPFEILAAQKKSTQPELKSKKPTFEFVKPASASRAEHDNEVLMAKLRKKLSEKMKHVAVRKYAQMWRAKVEKIKKIRESEEASLRHISLEDYLQLWGCPRTKYAGRTLERLSKRKKTNILVSALLHLNIIDKLDSKVRLVGLKTAKILNQVSIEWAERFGNIAQPRPVFWKLLLSLPSRSAEGALFPDKLRLWLQTAFHFRIDPLVSDLCCWTSTSGVPIFILPVLTEGCDLLETQGKNYCAAIFVSANGWESPAETDRRLKRVASLSSGTASLALLTLGNEPAQFVLDSTERSRFKFVHQSVWSDTNALVTSLFLLAGKHHMEDFNVKSLGFLTEVTTEKFLDMLYQNQYISEELNNDLTNLNYIIKLYNMLIDKLEHEISETCTLNFYALVCELKPLVESFKYVRDIFPENYRDRGAFKAALREHAKSFKLPEFKWSFEDSVGLMSEFKDYCSANKCSHLLSRIIRLINPPDSDSEIDLFAHLKDVSWLPVVELLAKSKIGAEAFEFRVVYRVDKLRELTLSHWWLK